MVSPYREGQALLCTVGRYGEVIAWCCLTCSLVVVNIYAALFIEVGTVVENWTYEKVNHIGHLRGCDRLVLIRNGDSRA